MRKIIFMFTCAIAMSMVSCGEANPDIIDNGTGNQNPDDNIDPEELVFDVSVADRVYNVGEEVIFAISGNAHEVNFFSGEKGHRYEYREKGEDVEITKMECSFSTQISGLKASENRQCERWVLVSTDFNGKQTDEASIHAATWTDITSSFTLATSNTRVFSGVVDMTGYRAEGKPFYIAFKYINTEYTVNVLGPSWRIYEFGLTGKTKYDEDVTLGVVNKGSHNAGFVGYNMTISPWVNTTVDENKDALVLRAELLQPVTPVQEIWIISSGLSVDSIPSDAETGEVIKYSFEKDIQEYKHSFDKPGEYNVTFVGKDLVTKEEEVKTIQITVQ